MAFVSWNDKLGTISYAFVTKIPDEKPQSIVFDLSTILNDWGIDPMGDFRCFMASKAPEAYTDRLEFF